MRDLEPSLLRERAGPLATDTNDLLTVHGTRVEHHRPPLLEVEAIGLRARLRHIPEAQSGAAEAVPLRSSVPLVVVSRPRAVFLSRFSDFRDAGGAGGEDDPRCFLPRPLLLAPPPSAVPLPAGGVARPTNVPLLDH